MAAMVEKDGMSSCTEFGHETHEIIGACIEVHNELGPGLLESAYEECLAIELQQRAIPFARQTPHPLYYKGVLTKATFQPDFVVRDLVIVELKAVHTLLPIFRDQLRTYLKLSGLRVGLLVNFNARSLRHGIRRVAA